MVAEEGRRGRREAVEAPPGNTHNRGVKGGKDKSESEVVCSWS